MRLFVAVWPPPGAVAALRALARPEAPGVRWTAEAQWHITLRFLGELDDERAAVDALASMGPVAGGDVVAALGPAVRRVGRGVLGVPVGGLGDVAAAVVDATAAVGRPPERRPFRGHVTVARLRTGRGASAGGRGGAQVPPGVVGATVAATWTVRDVHLVRSVLSPRGATYDTIAVHRFVSVP